MPGKWRENAEITFRQNLLFIQKGKFTLTTVNVVDLKAVVEMNKILASPELLNDSEPCVRRNNIKTFRNMQDLIRKIEI